MKTKFIKDPLKDPYQLEIFQSIFLYSRCLSYDKLIYVYRFLSYVDFYVDLKQKS